MYSEYLMFGLREKAATLLFGGGLTTLLAAATLQGAGAVPSSGLDAALFVDLAVLAQGASGLISNLIASKISGRKNRGKQTLRTEVPEQHQPLVDITQSGK
jgi:hypothetical protein